MDITRIIQPFEVGQEVYDDLTHEIHKVIGLKYEVGVTDPDNPQVSSMGCWGVWIDSKYLSGGRHPWEVQKLTDELRAEIFASTSGTVPAATENSGNTSIDKRKGNVMNRFKKRTVTREEFDAACEAVWSEIRYQNDLPRRTPDEAKGVSDFLLLLRRYIRRIEDVWSDSPATEQPDGMWAVVDAEHGLRKLAGIAVRAMIYTHIRRRGE